MVNHADVDAYLVALKSFARQTAVGRVVVVGDPTLTPADKALLAIHIPGIEIRSFEQCREPGLPKGGCWERIAAIADEVASAYVIQLDSDTVTLGPIPEVSAQVGANEAFLLASQDGISIRPVAEAAASAPRPTPGAHLQNVAEANLGVLAARGWKYARACAAFAGFPKGSFSRQTLHELCDAMTSAIGERWSEWGSEQVASNLVCASQPGARVLPHPSYCNATWRRADSVFVHFIGYVRYRSNAYRLLAQQVCRQLSHLERHPT